MPPLAEPENCWVDEVANRLRVIQTDAAAAPPERRREFLQEEINRSLNQVPAETRKRCLQALLARFPVAGQVAGNGSVPPPLPPPAPPPPPKSAEELLEAFLASAGQLTPETRTKCAKRLADAGLNWVDRDALVLEVSEELRKGLALPSTHQPRLTRLVELTLMLIELFHRLDHTALQTLSELSPRSPLLTRPRDFREAVAGFLTGTNDSVEPQVRAMASLLGALLAAVLRGGRDFGRQYVERFSPTAIEDVIKAEGRKSLFGNEKALYWDKYRDLAREYATADLVDRRIRDCLAALVEKTVLAGR